MRQLMRAVAVVLLLTFQLFAQTPQAAISASQQRAAANPNVERRVDEILGKMTLEEKIDMLGGVDGFYIRDYPRLGLPRLKMSDGPLGVRNYGPATTFPAGILLAATWD